MVARTHQEIDARSLAMHRAIAEKIRREPALLEKVRATITRWRPTTTPGELPYLEEWERLLNEGMEPLLEVAVEDSERGQVMRSCSPFTGILTEKERLAFLPLDAAAIDLLLERLALPEVQEAVFPLGVPDRERALEQLREALREIREERDRRDTP
jgi:hypothetical protein